MVTLTVTEPPGCNVPFLGAKLAWAVLEAVQAAARFDEELSDTVSEQVHPRAADGHVALAFGTSPGGPTVLGDARRCSYATDPGTLTVAPTPKAITAIANVIETHDMERNFTCTADGSTGGKWPRHSAYRVD